MTENEMERIEQAARAVFGHDDDEMTVAIPVSSPSFLDRLRALFRRAPFRRALFRRDRVLPGAALAR